MINSEKIFLQIWNKIPSCRHLLVNATYFLKQTSFHKLHNQNKENMLSPKSFLLPAFILLLGTAISQTKNTPSGTTSSGTGGKTVAEPPLKAKIKAVYPEKDPLFNFQVDIEVETGTIKAGDKIDAVSADGKRYSFAVVRLRNPFEDVKSADKESGTIYLMLKGPTDAIFNANFSFVNPGAAAPASKANAKSTDGMFTAVIDGAAWSGNGFSNAHLFYKGGVKQINKGKPSLVLTFKSTQSPDNRQLNIFVTTPDAKPGVYAGENIEMLLSGSPIGDEKSPELYGHKYPTSLGSNLKLEITAYKENSDGTATISGKISGGLKGILGAPKKELPLVSGLFENVIVKVYTEKY